MTFPQTNKAREKAREEELLQFKSKLSSCEYLPWSYCNKYEPWRRLKVPRTCFEDFHVKEGKKPNVYARLRNRAKVLGMPHEEYRAMTIYRRKTLWRRHLMNLYNAEFERREMNRVKASHTAALKHAEKKRGLHPHRISTTGKKMQTLDGYRLRVAYGGARAGKTHYILQEIAEQCVAYHPGIMWNGRKHYSFKVLIGGVNFAQMDAGLIADFRAIMQESNYWDGALWNNAKHTYTFPNGATIQFFTYESRRDPPGVACHIYFFNEANYALWPYFDNIRRRCMGYGWLDFNPTHEFWFNDRIVPNAKEYGLGVIGGLTYLDNEFLSATQIRAIEADKTNPQFWRIMGEGQFSEFGGLIFNKWTTLEPVKNDRGHIIRHIPYEAQIISRGLDWGGWAERTGQSRMAIVALYRYKEGYLLDLEMYDEKITAEQVATFLNTCVQRVPVMADLREHQDAAVIIRRHGVLNLHEVSKKKGTVRDSINYINQHAIWITERSIGLAKEHRRYVWAESRMGQIDYQMKPNPRSDQDAIDATRYAFQWEYLRGKLGEAQDTRETRQRNLRAFGGHRGGITSWW